MIPWLFWLKREVASPTTIRFERNLRPILTIESHSDVDLRRMLENIRALKLLENL